MLTCEVIRRFVLFLQILLSLWRSKDLPSLQVPKLDSYKGLSLLTQENANEKYSKCKGNPNLWLYGRRGVECDGKFTGSLSTDKV